MIWCVEDDASIRDIEVYALRSVGFEARGFSDGAAFWDALRARPAASAAVHGANAAVVGVLAAALYSPVFTTGVTSAWSFCLALVCFVMLVAWRTPPWAVVLLGCVVGALASLGGA